MKDQSDSDYIVAIEMKNTTLRSRVVTAPDVSVAIVRAVLNMSLSNEAPVRDGVILSVRVYKRVAVSETEINYAF